jgi:hypothetical protein
MAHRGRSGRGGGRGRFHGSAHGRGRGRGHHLSLAPPATGGSSSSSLSPATSRPSSPADGVLSAEIIRKWGDPPPAGELTRQVRDMHQALSARAEKAEKELGRLRGKLEQEAQSKRELQQQLAAEGNLRERYKGDRNAAEAKLKEATAERDTLRGDLMKAKAELARCDRTALAAAEEKVEALRQQLADQRANQAAEVTAKAAAQASGVCAVCREAVAAPTRTADAGTVMCVRPEDEGTSRAQQLSVVTAVAPPRGPRDNLKALFDAGSCQRSKEAKRGGGLGRKPRPAGSGVAVVPQHFAAGAARSTAQRLERVAEDLLRRLRETGDTAQHGTATGEAQIRLLRRHLAGAVTGLRAVNDVAATQISGEWKKLYTKQARAARADGYNHQRLPHQTNQGPERGKKRQVKNRANRLAQQHAKKQRQSKNHLAQRYGRS